MENKSGMQDIIERIRQMEAYMDEITEVLRKTPAKLCTGEELRKKVEILTNYMESGQWLADYEADERGELPTEVKRGVLSEDGLYNLIRDVEECFRMNEICQTVDKITDIKACVHRKI